VGALADAGRNVHGHPGQPVPKQLALAGVDAGAQLDAEPGGGDAQLLGTDDRRLGGVERHQEAVAPIGQHPAAGLVDGLVDDFVVALEQLAPPRVTESGEVLGRADNVGNQQCLVEPTGGRVRIVRHPGWRR
jgi:hypothetical protein